MFTKKTITNNTKQMTKYFTYCVTEHLIEYIDKHIGVHRLSGEKTTEIQK